MLQSLESALHVWNVSSRNFVHYRARTYLVSVNITAQSYTTFRRTWNHARALTVVYLAGSAVLFSFRVYAVSESIQWLPTVSANSILVLSGRVQ